METDGRPSTASLKFLDKRVAQLETDARLCKELLELSSDPKAAQVAWALLEGATSKALDYDLAVLPPRLTTAARARANLALRGATEAFAGCLLSDAEWQQATLPFWLGGAGLGIFAGTAAAARCAAAWLVSGREAMDLARRLGRPLARAPEAEEMEAACQLLGVARILMTEQALSLARRRPPSSWHPHGARMPPHRPPSRGRMSQRTHLRRTSAWQASRQLSASLGPAACRASQGA